MDIIIIAADEVQIKNIVNQIVHSTSDANIETFIDPLMALKYLYSHVCELVFVKTGIGRLPVTQLVNLIKRNCPCTDISIISDNAQYRRQAVMSGADRLLTETITKEMMNEIVNESTNLTAQ